MSDRGTLEETPRTTASSRIREVWDRRLRQSERELILSFAGIEASLCADQSWTELAPYTQRQTLIAMRDLVQLGNEAAYALGYSRRNG